MTSERNVAVEPRAAANEKKVEVTVDGDQAIIQMSSYAEDIGWFVQKTIIVDAGMLDAIAEQFSAARGKIRRESDEILSAEVLEF